jgi:hypothetical protein
MTETVSFCDRVCSARELTLLHLLLLALELGGDIAGTALGQDAVGRAGDAHMGRLGRGMVGSMVVSLVLGSLEADGGSRAGLGVMAGKQLGGGAGGERAVVPIGDVGSQRLGGGVKMRHGDDIWERLERCSRERGEKRKSKSGGSSRHT